MVNIAKCHVIISLTEELHLNQNTVCFGSLLSATDSNHNDCIREP